MSVPLKLFESVATGAMMKRNGVFAGSSRRHPFAFETVRLVPVVDKIQYVVVMAML
jgi:hypothetical protein